MPPNRQAQRVAREVGRSYDEIRRSLNVLIYLGNHTEDEAERAVKKLAAAGAEDISDTARALVASKDRDRDEEYLTEFTLEAH